ncbi:uncharacterized protein LY89DRAFT_686356 [Mollisia scopiformis]|uniref:Uncharacterized protein n=1 Tax=Mollisia scopiformis TaxID=149040 RepID=A0A194X4C2_MOLSC|nr:uncharacterized protein LY89DRAFT_686356 [Mollisia scopiformis]KUJ14677.1 hypothetical protein LY89DRAFT_686356 [Mollisia scopiformis]
MPIPSVAHIDAEWPRKEASPTSKEYRPWNVKPGIGWRQLNWWYWQVRKQLFRERGSTSTDKFLRTFPREDRESFGLFGPKVPKEPRFYGSILHEIDYSEFPCYRDRIQTLRLYMDNAKPRGLKGLLKDKRDTVGYYTFWGTLGVGVTAIFLSVASFAVSVYQAWAASKSIPQSNA